LRIRNLGELVKVKRIDDDAVKLEKPVFAPASGQSGVIYARTGNVGEEVVVGGGIIV
jgi:tRNA U34 2-thiouridine synthase MnmA/TrmU